MHRNLFSHRFILPAAVAAASRSHVGGGFSRAASVWSFGDNSNGALGIPSPLLDAYEPTKLPSLPATVSAVASGHYHSLAVEASGEVWAWGRNEECQLGRGAHARRDTWTKPERVLGLDNVKAQAAYASGVVSSAIGSDGSLWVWGRSKRGQLGLGEGVTEAIMPTKVEALSGHEIRKVSFGWGHALAQTKEGKLFGWGYAACGRLGDGTVLSFGDNTYGQLGRDTKGSEFVHVPTNFHPLRLSAGLGHSLLLCRVPSEGDPNNATGILSWGWNRSSQLGHQGQEDAPARVEGLEGEKLVSVSAGRVHSICLTSKGEVLAWGSGRNGRLGIGSSADEAEPTFVECLEGLEVLQAVAGFDHNLLLVADSSYS